MQADGLAKRLDHAHAKTAVIGISGGLDSCLALLVAVRAMKQLGRPTTDVRGRDHALLRHHAPHPQQRRDSVRRAERLVPGDRHCQYRPQPFCRHRPGLRTCCDVTFENGQARDRTLDADGPCQPYRRPRGGHRRPLTSWPWAGATYNGDHMSMYGVNAGVPKTLVRHLVQYEARTLPPPKRSRPCCWTFWTRRSPRSCCPPSDDGEIAQKTEDLVGPYELHDFFLYHVLRFGFRPREDFPPGSRPPLQAVPRPGQRCCTSGCATSTAGSLPSSSSAAACRTAPRWARVTLSPRGDWRMPSDAAAALWLAELEQIPLNDNIG